jgi:hypothetical protein
MHAERKWHTPCFTSIQETIFMTINSGENMEFDVIVAKDLQALVNTVQDYVKTGWVLKGEVFEKDGSFTQQVERHVASNAKPKKAVSQRSWIAWPEVIA